MATNEWVGNVTGVQQISTITAGGPGTSTAQAGVVVGGVSVTVATANTMTAAAFAALLYNALNAAADPQVRELSYGYNAGDAFITATGNSPGVAVSITGVTAGGITVTPALVTAATGPNDAAAVGNWSLGHVPAGGGEKTLIRSGPAILYGIDTAFAACDDLEIMASWTGGLLGLPDRNPAGYREWRPTRAIVHGGRVQVGTGQVATGGGPGRVRLSTNAANMTLAVFATSGPNDAGEPGAVDIDLPIAFRGTSLFVMGGTVTLNRDGGGGRPGIVHVSGGMLTVVGVLDMSTAVLDIDGGTVVGGISSTGGGGRLDISGGTVAPYGDCDIREARISGGTLALAWNPQHTIKIVASSREGKPAPTVDARSLPGTLTLTADSSFTGGAKLIDPGNQVLTDAAGCAFDGASLAASDFGGPVVVIR